MHKSVIYKFIMGAILAVLITACGDGGSDGQPSESVATPHPDMPAAYSGKVNPVADSADAISEGKLLFESTCAACHGSSGLGDGPAAVALTPAPASLVELNKTAADDHLLWRISEGKEGTAMVSWKASFTEDQIWQIISYLRTFK